MIAIVDYGMGNLRSVEKAFLHVGADARVVADAQSIEDASAIVLPGVGAFRDCVRNLEDLRITRSIIDGIEKGKPFLGICLGLQVLFTESEEFGHTKGLGIFEGTVPRFPETALKVPHMGWNTVRLTRRPPIFTDDIPDNSYFYFVHSYYVKPTLGDITAGTTTYGLEFTSMVWKDNVFATQFHPEKSQGVGLQVLKGFSEFAKKA